MKYGEHKEHDGFYFSVIPAKAGIQGHEHRQCLKLWTPAFAGVTTL